MGSKTIKVEILDPKAGGLVAYAAGIMTATERAPGVYRVRDGSFDFTFSKTELDAQDWIRIAKSSSTA